MTPKTSRHGNRKGRGGQSGFVLISQVIGVIIGALAFAAMSGSIALVVKNAAALKTELTAGLEQRNASAVEMKTLFGKE